MPTKPSLVWFNIITLKYAKVSMGKNNPPRINLKILQKRKDLGGQELPNLYDLPLISDTIKGHGINMSTFLTWL